MVFCVYFHILTIFVTDLQAVKGSLSVQYVTTVLNCMPKYIPSIISSMSGFEEGGYFCLISNIYWLYIIA